VCGGISATEIVVGVEVIDHEGIAGTATKKTKVTMTHRHQQQ